MTYLILHGIMGHAGDHWEKWLNSELTKRGNVVLMPQLPDPDHPDRKTWLAKVKEILSGVDLDKLVIVGHSLGVVTALDFIEQANQKVNGLVSVSGFYRDYRLELNSFFMTERKLDMKKVKANLKKAVAFYSDNDPYVPQTELKSLADELDAKPVIIPNGGHLNAETGYTTFPKLLEIALKF